MLNEDAHLESPLILSGYDSNVKHVQTSCKNLCANCRCECMYICGSCENCGSRISLRFKSVLNERSFFRH